MQLARESAHDVWSEIQPLILEHWEEIAHFGDIALAPREELYRFLQDSGKLYVFTLRDDGKLIGYAVFVVDFDIHYANSLQAKQDVLFLLPGYRNAGNGAALIGFCDAELAKAGVQCVYHHVKHAHNFGPLLAAMRYKSIETIHVKRLDRGG